MQKKHSINKIALLHFLPLELYPPVMNFIDCETKYEPGKTNLINVYTTRCTIKELAPYKAFSDAITIKRFGSKRAGNGAAKRLIHYLRYYLTAIVQLAVTRPGTVFYYDTISSFPAWCYKCLFNRSCRIFIHYHEYMTKEEYAGGMVLLKWFHKLEMRLYSRAEWVSHTNKERMQLFINDMPGLNIKNKNIVPNYPPQSWKQNSSRPVHSPVRFIQVGSLGMDTMYIKEFAEWIIAQQGKAVWDVYALTIDPAATDYLASLKTNAISFKGKVNYNELPSILQQYDVGVILYKGHIPNYIYNAPNKMFEYYTCGLDVWFPAQMVTAAQYTTSGTFPRMVPVVFENLSLQLLNDIEKKYSLQYSQVNYSAEEAFAELLKKLAYNEK